MIAIKTNQDSEWAEKKNPGLCPPQPLSWRNAHPCPSREFCSKPSLSGASTHRGRGSWRPQRPPRLGLPNAATPQNHHRCPEKILILGWCSKSRLRVSRGKSLRKQIFKNPRSFPFTPRLWNLWTSLITSSPGEQRGPKGDVAGSGSKPGLAELNRPSAGSPGRHCCTAASHFSASGYDRYALATRAGLWGHVTAVSPIFHPRTGEAVQFPLSSGSAQGAWGWVLPRSSSGIFPTNFSSGKTSHWKEFSVAFQFLEHLRYVYILLHFWILL